MCVPTRAWPDLLVGGSRVDLAVFGRVTDQPVVVDAAAGIAAFGTPAQVVAERLGSLNAPAFSVADLDGTDVSLSDFGGQKKLLVSFASWCGCRYDLPDWQTMHAELRDHDFTVIAVAVDERAEDVREWVEGPDGPATASTTNRSRCDTGAPTDEPRSSAASGSLG